MVEKMIISGHSIGAVERDVGIRSATLRMWERRYGFPKPIRDAGGDRLYPDEQLERLRLIRRLLNHGYRPGAVVALAEGRLRELLDTVDVPEGVSVPKSASLQPLLAAADAQDGEAFVGGLQRLLLQQGVSTFIRETLAPLLATIGQRWADGDLQIYQEHFLTRQVHRFLDATMSQMGRATGSRPILLATVSGEQHALGNLMLELLLVHAGENVRNLGTEIPLEQLVAAVEDTAASVLALSFSGSYPYRTMREALKELAQRLPQDVTIWIGGAGVAQMRRMPDRRIERKRLEDF
jgi:DNA-binding transcriptional MerR regulator/methylmalonyl-CoA mutase cobalamin-binding subunit